MGSQRPVFLVDRALTSCRMLEAYGQVEFYDHSPLERRGQVQPNALFIRSVTPIDNEIVSGFPTLERIYTATAGLDHIDGGICARAGVEVKSAPGHNAEAVADWVWTVLLSLVQGEKRSLEGLQLCVVGAGHTGTAVGRRGEAHGVDVVYYDPPRQERESEFKSASCEAILESDVVSFHVPLEEGGAWPTKGMMDLGDFVENQWVLNASRGAVLSRNSPPASPGICFAFDVFPNEPDIPVEWIGDAALVTPHVGGNTHGAKWEATRALADHAAQDYPPQPDGLPLGEFVPQSHPGKLRVEEGESGESVLLRVLEHWAGLGALSAEFRTKMKGADDDKRAAAFRGVRKRSRRFGFQGRTLSVDEPLSPAWLNCLESHGIRVKGEGDAELHVGGKMPSFLKGKGKPE